MEGPTGGIQQAKIKSNIKNVKFDYKNTLIRFKRQWKLAIS